MFNGYLYCISISTYIRILMIWYLNCKNIIMLHSFINFCYTWSLSGLVTRFFPDEKRYWIVLLSVIYEWSWLYWILPLPDFVSDFEFSPFDDYLLATGSADNSVSLEKRNHTPSIEKELFTLAKGDCLGFIF